jgi:hypothetical protein
MHRGIAAVTADFLRHSNLGSRRSFFSAGPIDFEWIANAFVASVTAIAVENNANVTRHPPSIDLI